MGYMVRKNPATPCQPEGKHHPHRWICADVECGCEDDWPIGPNTSEWGPYTELNCCICRSEWPCQYIKTKHKSP